MGNETMELISYIELESLCLAVIVGMLMFTVIHTRREGRKVEILLLMTYGFNMLMVATDIAWALTICFKDAPDTALHMNNFLYFLAAIAAAFSWFMYCCRDYNNGRRLPVLFVMLTALPVVFVAGMSVLTPNGNWMVKFTDGIYRRGYGYNITLDLELAYMLAASVMVLIRHLGKGALKHYTEYTAVLIYPIPIAIFAVAQILTGCGFKCIGVTLSLALHFAFNVIRTFGDRRMMLLRLTEDYDAILVVNTETDIIVYSRLSERFGKRFGREQLNGRKTLHSLIDTAVGQTVYPDDRPYVREQADPEFIRQILKEQGSHTFEFKFMMPNGDIRYGNCRTSYLYPGNSREFLVGIRDISSTKEQELHSMEQSMLIDSLTDDFEAIFLVDMDTHQMIPIRVSEDYFRKYKVMTSGKNYDDRIRFNIAHNVYIGDRERVTEEFSIERVRERFKTTKIFHVDYRKVSGDDVHFYQAKFVKTEEAYDGDFFILGYHSVDDEHRQELQRINQQAIIEGLLDDFEAILAVDLETNEVVHYRVSDTFERNAEGWSALTDYATIASTFTNLLVTEDSREKFADAVRKSSLIEGLKEQRAYFINTKLKLDGTELYYQIKCARSSAGENRILVGFHSVDAETRRELEREQELSEARTAAEQASEAKSDFLSKMSHDIRTPVNGIMGMTEIAEKHIKDPERLQDCLGKIKRASHHLTSLVNDVLDMSRIESGKTQIRYAHMDMHTFTDSCASLILGYLKDRDLFLVRDFSGFEHAGVLGDELRLRQVLLNILGNAVKYTLDGGIISFVVREIAADEAPQSIRDRLEPDSVVYRFAVRDTGIGMKPDFLEHIWEAFAQEDEGTRTTYKGTGLGMAITKSLVEMMGGVIEVVSEYNVGSTFTVYVPFRIDNMQETSSEHDGDGSDIYGARILLAEDNDLNMEIARELLESEGAIVTTAQNGRIVCDIFAGSDAGSFDVILMDIMMPEMDGLQATRMIRSMDHPDADSIPIIAMTANAYDTDVSKSMEAGMNAHIAKPLDFAYVKKVIAGYLKRHVTLAD